ncbi:DUF948 domain-containing protein [Planococcus halocryophilus]|uniref:DUF948 domain-containing protein n=1 Tax=Planococcus halocryophilus TaxID=1215089 RepID=UPI001F0DFBB5|nr:DUF948 domain-containing protein [Planococcus halocryophilus]MCH4826394.1 DUF948 domain-containing protein [Planococcus halocryophilus]
MDSTTWLYIALIIFLAGLIIAIIGVVLLIVGMKEPMKEIKGSANNLKERADKLQLEAASLSHHANELKEDIQMKSEKITVLVDAAKGTMNSVIDLNASVRSITGNIASRVDHDRENIAQVNEWSNGAIKFLTLLENQRRIESNRPTYSSPSLHDEKQY